jgi:hypothetical protein
MVIRILAQQAIARLADRLGERLCNRPTIDSRRRLENWAKDLFARKEFRPHEFQREKAELLG